MHPKRICRSCDQCAFTRPELCSAYRLASFIHARESFNRCPDMETYLHYLQSGLADEMADVVEDFLADLRARLTQKQFEVLISHVYHGRSLKAIARVEGISFEAARQRLTNALQKARGEWGKKIDEKTRSRRRRGRSRKSKRDRRKEVKL